MDTNIVPTQRTRRVRHFEEKKYGQVGTPVGPQLEIRYTGNKPTEDEINRRLKGHVDSDADFNGVLLNTLCHARGGMVLVAQPVLVRGI